ncbi:hypothetical protein Tco_0780616 [Tanacetum coccineum]
MQLHQKTSIKIALLCQFGKILHTLIQPTKDVDIGEPKSGANDQKQVKKGLDNEKDKSVRKSSLTKLIIEPTSIAKVLSDSSWVEAMQEKLLQFKL